jgi:hypothetical protein
MLMDGAAGYDGTRMWEMKEKTETSGRSRKSQDLRSDGADAAEWVRTRLDLAVDSLQARVARTTNKRGILNCSRQWGKSTSTAAKARHQAYNTAESLTVVVSPSGRQSGEFLRKANGVPELLTQRLDRSPGKIACPTTIAECCDG